MNIVKVCTGAALVVSLVAQPALAGGPKFLLQPVPVGAETVRFNQGIPTVDLHGKHGTVQITPLPMDHGSLAFSVAVYNDSGAPANIDISNFDAAAGPQRVGLFSRDELEGKAKKRAMWAQIAMAAAGGLAAAAAANQRDHYSATTFTPHGTYRTFISTPSAAGQVQAAASVAAAGVGIAAVQNQLDKTRQMLGDTTVQLTTVDPGDSYGGRIVLAKVSDKALPQRVTITVNFAGEAFPFAFQMAKKGTPQPVFPVTPPLPVAPDTAPAPPASSLTPAAVEDKSNA